MFKPTSPTSNPQRIDRFPCSKCGALLKFSPGTHDLICEYCGQQNYIEDRSATLMEYDLGTALAELAQQQPMAEVTETQCGACGAGFKFNPNVHAGDCPFCGTPIVTSTAEKRPITPKSLLPFKIDESKAKQQFKRWLNGLWFAPNKVKRYADSDTKLTGVYIPYWTFDSATETRYTGARGDIHYVTREVTYETNGQYVTETKQVPEMRWSPAQGIVSRFFDDVLVGASKSLPRQILDKLEPWDLQNLVPYNESYLSGFSSEYYQVNLDQGFDDAKHKMDSVIYSDIARDIGGDQQRIDSLKTIHNHPTFKHCLLPVWSAAFRYQAQSYRFIINGRTGQVQGERPYSYWKIGFTVVFGFIIVLGLYVFLDRAGMLQNGQTTAHLQSIRLQNTSY